MQGPILVLVDLPSVPILLLLPEPYYAQQKLSGAGRRCQLGVCLIDLKPGLLHHLITSAPCPDHQRMQQTVQPVLASSWC